VAIKHGLYLTIEDLKFVERLLYWEVAKTSCNDPNFEKVSSLHSTVAAFVKLIEEDD
jgi:hypothetical protein